MGKNTKIHYTMNREMPSQEEYDEVVWYVLKRPLSRPNTSYGKAVLYITFFFIINVLIIFALNYLFDKVGISSFLPKPIKSIYTNHHTMFILILSLLQFVISTVVVAKPAIIGAIHLYQKYALEHTRRRCLFKPTCSEYAILAIKKYGVIRGLHKAYIRLFKKCRGRIYRIDEP